jgi:hypothetical protein
LHAKNVDAYIDPDESTDIRAATAGIALRLGIERYDVSAVERLRNSIANDCTAYRPMPATAGPLQTTIMAVNDDRRLLRLHPGTITQVLVEPDERGLSIQVRHRLNEVVGHVVVNETDEVAEIRVSVGTPADDPRRNYVLFGDAFTRVCSSLRRPLGNRRIVYANTELSRAGHDEPSAVTSASVDASSSVGNENPHVASPCVRPKRRFPIISRLRSPNIGLKLLTLVVVPASLLIGTTSRAL